MSHPTVLIVDDSESICSALSSMLQLHGYTTLVAHNGRLGVAMAREHQPDVVLLDIMMPVLDGWGAMQELQSDVRTAAIPVVALTALRLSEQKIRDTGFHGYLYKPVTPHRLLEELQAALLAPV